jgi:hypothetical protein
MAPPRKRHIPLGENVPAILDNSWCVFDVAGCKNICENLIFYDLLGFAEAIMGSRYFTRPENAISKADEFMKVGKLIFLSYNIRYNYLVD